MHIILTGATGLVGSAVLDSMIKNKAITKISILSRRPVKMAEDIKDPRIDVILHQDFETYDSKILKQLQGARACVWALGVSQNSVDKEAYVKITKGYALAAARSFLTLPSAASEEEAQGEKKGEPFRFVFVSGEGATQAPTYFSALYMRIKGETEKALSDLASATPSLRVDSVRPAVVDPRKHEAILPYIPDPGLLYKAAFPAAALYVKFVPGMHSPTQMLGDGLTRLAMGKLDGKIEGAGAFRLGSSWILENVGLRRVMDQ